MLAFPTAASDHTPMLKSRDPNCDRAQSSHETRFHRGPAFVNGALLLLSALCVVSSLAAVNWPELRGPLRNGHALDANPPLSWSETKRIVWKTAIHDLGWSSPVVWGEQNLAHDGHHRRA